MNLLKSFPEIELFFENDKFSQDELLLFLVKIEKKYQDDELRKAVSTLLSLKILQYEIFPEENLKNSNIVEKAKKTNYKAIKVDKIHPLLNEIKFYSIENISNSLDWSSSRTLRLLKQNGITKIAENILNENEFNVVKDMFNNRLLGLERIHKAENPTKNIVNKSKIVSRNRSLNNSDDVYSRIRATGLGKVIYIRKK